MKKPCIFVSCGQRTSEEKNLGLAICKLIADTGNLTYFFAESQHNLDGLHDNIMKNLADAAGFIAVMHPRGTVFVDSQEEPLTTRASVWIEQEIAIAAYINRTRPNAAKLRTAVYCHASVGREGMRDLLHLNPVLFERDEEVLQQLDAVLHDWSFNNESFDTEGELFLDRQPIGFVQNLGHINNLVAKFRNDGPRATQWSCNFEVPALLVSPLRNNDYEVGQSKPGYRRFHVAEHMRSYGCIYNGSTEDLLSVETILPTLDHAQRMQLLSTPFLITADIGGRIYRTQIPVTDVYGRVPFGLQSADPPIR